VERLHPSVTEKVHDELNQRSLVPSEHLIFPILRLIGKIRKLSVQRGKLASIGRTPKDLANQEFWRSLIKAIAKFVHQKNGVPEAEYTATVNSLSRSKRHIRLCKKDVNIRKPRNSKSVTLKGQVLKGRFLKPSMPSGCADVVTVVWLKPIYNMS